ncbi:MAG: RNB domain-containing ribonuclease, partial [Bdellovibrionales bacterium]
MKTSSRHRHLKDTHKPRRDKRKGVAAPVREESTRVVGVLARDGKGWKLQSTNRRERGDYTLHAKPNFKLEEGLLAVAEKISARRWQAREAKLIDVLGDINAPRAVSLIAIATHGIPDEFSKEAIAEAEAAKPVTLDHRTDLRDIPLVTIDGADARDFDDAVFAEKDGDGWHLIVAIADV